MIFDSFKRLQHLRRSDNTVTELMQEEQKSMVQYACYYLGNIDDARDMVQDLYVKVYQQADRTKQMIPSEIRNYLYRCLRNSCVDQLRREQKRQFVGLEHISGMEEEKEYTFEREYARIEAMLSQIPTEQAEVIRLRTHAGRSFAEIADILGIPQTTAKSRFAYGIEKMRKEIGRNK